MSEEQDFLGIATRARANDYESYRQLEKIAEQTNKLGQDASRVILEIDDVLQGSRLSLATRNLEEVDGNKIYMGPYTSDEISRRFGLHYDARTREALVNAIRNEKSPLFVYALVEMFTNEDDLLTADRITLALSEVTGQDFHPRDYERIKSWWKQEHGSFTNWPMSDFNDAMLAFSEVHYGAAARDFEKILDLDQNADLSRALCIACYLAIGQTNDANKHLKEFRAPETRWAQWAAMKVELDSSNVSNGTVQLVNLISKFPTIAMQPNKADDIWRKVDWQLYDRLTLTNLLHPVR